MGQEGQGDQPEVDREDQSEEGQADHYLKMDQDDHPVVEREAHFMVDH